MDLHHFNGDPNSTYRPDADPDSDFYADPDPNFDADPDLFLMRIRIRMRVQVTKMMRIPIHNTAA
jgi:hypothetical protein